MKIRLLPVFITVIVTAVLLFGGYFAYQSYAMENPLQKIVTQAPGVESASMEIGQDKASFDLKLRPDANIREIVHTIQTNGASILGKRTVDVKVTNESSQTLDQWWSSHLFEIAQAMETKHYSDIPTTLANAAKDQAGLQVSTDMDESNVYIRLTEGDKSKFVILPRTAAKIGVWPNE